LKAWYEFGVKYPASYSNEQTRTEVLNPWFTAAGWYPSTSVYDDLCLAALYLYKYTNEQKYMDEALDHYPKAENSFYSSSWDAQGPLINVLLFELTKDEKYLTAFRFFSDDRLPGGSIPFTPYGLSWGGAWGTFAHAMCASNQMLYMAKLLGKDDEYSKRMTTFAISQANYILGDTGYTWMTGFVPQDQPQPFRLNHISSFNPYDDEVLNNNKTLTDDWGNFDFLNNLTPNRRICYGGIPSGPDQSDTYQDDHRMYQYSEPTQDYTAPAVGVFAALVEHYGTEKFTPFSDCTLDLGWDAPGRMADATKKPNYPEDDCYHTCNREQGKKCTPQSSLSSAGVADSDEDASGAIGLEYAAVLGLLVLALA
jgi:endoglucanase